MTGFEPATRIETGETFKVSVAVLEVDMPGRMGREALEITRQRIVEAGKRFRGYRLSDEEIAALPPDESVAPPATLDGDARAADWLGLAWRSAVVEEPGREDVGVYRIGTGGVGPLDYLGQGMVAARWRAHASGWAVDLAAERTDESLWDWAGLSLGARQLLEVENDLIASHMVVFSGPPRVQFGGGGVPHAGAPKFDARNS